MRSKKEIFKAGSKTYYNASRFFPKDVREDVFTLYAFVRIVDDYVDNTPQQKKEFLKIKRQLKQALDGTTVGNKIVDDFAELARRKEFSKEEIDGFMHSMESDLYHKKYTSIEESLEYMYGSAEVIGLFMSKIIGLKEELYPYAQLLGRAMQYINFIRDIDEDLKMDRWYLPINLTKGKITPTKEWLRSHPNEFKWFVTQQIDQYLTWQLEAQQAFAHIPRKYRIPIKVASNMYRWTAKQIMNNPQVIFSKKIKPSKSFIILNN
jgi:phytoene synthase